MRRERRKREKRKKVRKNKIKIRREVFLKNIYHTSSSFMKKREGKIFFLIICSLKISLQKNYLGNILNNFICEESIKMTFIRASISIKGHHIMINQNTKEWERWNQIPIFPIEATTLCFVFLLIIAIPTISQEIFIILFYI